MDRIESDQPTAVLWPKYGHASESHGGAITGEHDSSIQSITSRKKIAGME
jgi:hypothetical protein